MHKGQHISIDLYKKQEKWIVTIKENGRVEYHKGFNSKGDALEWLVDLMSSTQRRDET